MSSSGVRTSARGTSADRLELSAHGFDIALAPGFGGRIDRARYRGQDILAPRQRLEDPNPLDAGCFALVPFSNRIRQGRFTFEGQSYTLPRNWSGDAHAIHGEGWQQSWQVGHHDSESAVLTLQGTDWWPWAYDCVQTIRLRENALELSLTLTNRDTTPMPAGLGFHPYFLRTPETQLGFEASRIWTPMDAGPLAARTLGPGDDFSAPRKLKGLDFDHCYEGWPGEAVIKQPDHGLDLTLSASPGSRPCVLYVPRGEPVFCLEPVTHLTGAFELGKQSATGLETLAPGARMDFAMRLEVRPG